MWDLKPKISKIWMKASSKTIAFGQLIELDKRFFKPEKTPQLVFQLQSAVGGVGS